MADYAGFKERKKAAKKSGKLRGIGIGCYLEIAGAFPEEGAAISFPGGKARCRSASAPAASGQGHRTVFGKVAARRLGVPLEAVELARPAIQRRDVPGFGAVASRSAMYVGGAIANTCDAVIAKGKKRRGHAAAGAGGSDRVRRRHVSAWGNRERKIDFTTSPSAPANSPGQGVIPESLDTKGGVKAPPSFPNGCHVAEVEIDPATGKVEIVKYVGGRRLRQRARRHHRHRAGARRRGAGHRPGAHREHHLRRRRPARVRLVHGLRACRAPTTRRP